MAAYTIIRIYEVPGRNRIEATERMMEALDLHVEGDFHVTDIIREKEAKRGSGKPVNLRPSASWLELIVKQIIGL